MSKKRSKSTKPRKSATPKDLAVGARKSRGVSAGRAARLGGTDIVKTPTPGGPLPVPYPN
jgi:hypothetical protein